MKLSGPRNWVLLLVRASYGWRGGIKKLGVNRETAFKVKKFAFKKKVLKKVKNARIHDGKGESDNVTRLIFSPVGGLWNMTLRVGGGKRVEEAAGVKSCGDTG